MLSINCSIDENGNFIISNNGNGSVESGGDVQWNVTGNRLDTISISPTIDPTKGDSAIWAVVPRPFPDNTPPKVSKNWRGTVISNPSSTSSIGEDYNIGHRAKNGASGSRDPRISVNPKTKVDEV